MWRPVIHINLLRSINFILGLLDYRSPSASPNNGRLSVPSSPGPSSPILLPEHLNFNDEFGLDGGGTKPLSEEIRRLCIRLKPLREVEDSLTRKIAGFVPEQPPSKEGAANGLNPSIPSRYHPSKACEVSIRSGRRNRLIRFRRRSESSILGGEYDEAGDILNRRIIHACAEDIRSIWINEEVQDVLREKGIALQSQPGL